MKFSVALSVTLSALLSAAPAVAAETATHGFSGADLGLVWVVPFAGILLSIALFPLLAPGFWHHHFGKVSAFWALAFVGPFTALYGVDVALHEVLHTLLLEYIPFIILLLALFTVAGGVRVMGSLVGTPATNTVMLAIGTVIASWMGTTGAAMLMIRPMIRANEWRQRKVHVFVFFIFLVANIGGSLTPLGDPPLFLGFLKGVGFFWTTIHMLPPMLLVGGLLLVLFYVIDARALKQDGLVPPSRGRERVRIQGWANIVLLGCVVGAVLLSGVWNPGVDVNIGGIPVPLQGLARDLLLLCITAVSYFLTSRENRRENAFTWFPIVEVAKLFAGIFLTIIPAIAILRAGEVGALSAVVGLVNQGGQPIPMAYFWLTGILSSFLDNAPTYLVFFNTAGGDPVALMGPLQQTLLAISAGAVFMGANTYIGNAPNFMVKAICEERGIPMPSFFGYMAWSIALLVPLFLLTTLVFFV